VHIRADLVQALEQVVPKSLRGNGRQTLRVNWVIEEYCRIAQEAALRRQSEVSRMKRGIK